MARKVPFNMVVVQQQDSVDLADAAGDVALTLRCPGDGAKVLDWKVISTTAGTGAGANHNIILEHGSGAAGVALTGTIALDADGTAETTTASGNGLLVQPATTMGTLLQINNTESAAISNGAIVTVIVRWIL